MSEAISITVSEMQVESLSVAQADGIRESSRFKHNRNPQELLERCPDLKVEGHPDMVFKQFFKVSSDAEKWMTSFKGCEIPGMGVLCLFTTLDNGTPSETMCFVPGVRIVQQGYKDSNGDVKTGNVLTCAPED